MKDKGPPCIPFQWNYKQAAACERKTDAPSLSIEKFGGALSITYLEEYVEMCV